MISFAVRWDFSFLLQFSCIDGTILHTIYYLLAAVLLARKMADLTHAQCKNGAMSYTGVGLLYSLFCVSYIFCEKLHVMYSILSTVSLSAGGIARSACCLRIVFSDLNRKIWNKSLKKPRNFSIIMTKSARNNSVFFTAAMFGFIASHRLEIGKIISPLALKIDCSRSYHGILSLQWVNIVLISLGWLSTTVQYCASCDRCNYVELHCKSW